MFGHKKKQTSGKPSKKASSDAAIKTLFCHINPLGWRASLLDGSGKPVGEPHHSDQIDLTETDLKRTEKIVQNFLKAYPRKRWKQIDRLAVLLDGQPVSFTDAKPSSLHAASPAAAREYGQRLVNSQSVTFAYKDFAPLPKEKGRGVYAFTDVDRLKTLTGLFADAAPKIVEIVPTPYLFLQRAEQQAEQRQTYGALYVSAYESILLLANTQASGLIVRSIPVGIITLITALSQNTSTTRKAAHEALKKRDLLTDIAMTEAQIDAAASMSLTPHQQALGPLLTQLAHEIARSLDFFEMHRICGRPESLEVFGAFNAVNGLKSWLSEHVHESLHFDDNSVLDLYTAQHPAPLNFNLLKGSDEPLLTVGKVQYSFFEKGFVNSEQLAHDRASALSVVGSSKSSRQSSSSSQKKKGGLFGLFAKESEQKSPASIRGPGKRGGTTRSKDAEKAAAKQDQGYWMAFLIVIALVFYMAYDEYAQKEKRYRNTFSQYKHQREEAIQLRNFLKQRERDGSRAMDAVDQRLTKVLWTEKFMAIANHLDQHIWLTDVYLSGSTREVKELTVSDLILVIEGAVLPSSVGHVEKIAGFIDRLLSDDQHFMSDFRDIQFKGAHLDKTENDPIVTFTIEAHYDPKVRLNAEKVARKQGTPIDQMQGNIQDHNKALTDAL